jgi:Domain of unknown function (DUF5655)/Domain of unknown function (DUF4287)
VSTPEEARATQLRNIEAKTGLSLAALRAAVQGSGRVKHGEIRAWLIETYELGYGDANGLAAATLEDATKAGAGSADEALAEIYTGKKAHLRPVHDAVMTVLVDLGAFEIAPKKGYVALRRKKQFAMLGPKTAERSELSINLKADVASPRVLAQKPGGMCQYAVALTGPEDVDEEVIAVLKAAFEAAG